MKIGLISDTHNYLDPKVPAIFKGIDHILHAGDVCVPKVILDLEAIAPVTAVLGNNDSFLTLKETEKVELAGKKFMVHHIVSVHDANQAIRRRIAREHPDVMVFGHTHEPFNQVIGRTWFINPGYAGKPRFSLSRSVAILHCEAGNMRLELINL